MRRDRARHANGGRHPVVSLPERGDLLAVLKQARQFPEVQLAEHRGGARLRSQNRWPQARGDQQEPQSPVHLGRLRLETLIAEAIEILLQEGGDLSIRGAQSRS
jgi:hypothetical protein